MLLTPYPSLAALPEVAANGGKVPARSIDAFATRTVYASTIPTVELDCDLATGSKIGSGTATDNSAALNAVVAASVATAHTEIVIDGPSLVHGAMVLPSGGNITVSGKGWGSGLRSASGSNDCTIRSADSPLNPFDPGGTPPTIGSGGNVHLRDFRIEGNHGTYPHGNVSTTGDGWAAYGRISDTTDGPLYTGIDLCNYDGITIDHVWVNDPPCFCVRINNSKVVFLSNSRFESPNRDIVTDGNHFGGYVSDVHGVNLHYGVGDDARAFNGDEGYRGPIDRVVYSNITLDNCSAGIRIDGESQPVRKACESNVVGDVLNYYLLYGNNVGAGSPAGTNESYRLANADITVTGAAGFPASGGVDGTYGFALICGSGNSIEIDGVALTHPTVAGSWFYWLATSSASTVDCISIRGKVVRNALGSSVFNLLTMTQGTLKLLRIEDYAVIDQAGSSYSAIPNLIDLSGSCALSRIWIESLDATHHSAFCNDFSKITSIAGPGVATCGFAFPDSVIANGTLYNSSTQGGLSWKNLSGTVTKLAS